MRVRISLVGLTLLHSRAMSYEAKAKEIAERMELYSRDGTRLDQHERETCRALNDIACLFVEMAREVDTKLAALPQTPETFAQHGVRRDERNPFGY